jgi:two-component system nitrate/nitrite response regulator NarL
MRVVLVGADDERERLRRGLDGAAEVIGEFPTLAAARAASLDADAFILYPYVGRSVGSGGEVLSPRELEVLVLVAEGLSNKGIAARLGISDQTVKFHVAAITGKLGAANRTEAVRVAVRRGLIAL